MTYDSVITALENIIFDEVMTAQSSKFKKSDTSSPMDTGMVAKAELDETRTMRNSESQTSQCQPFTKTKAAGAWAKARLGGGA